MKNEIAIEYRIVARGRQAKYGTLRMILDGHIERPRLDLFFDRPNESMGLRAVRLLLQPTAAGFDYTSNGTSRLGLFTSNGKILLPPGGRATIAIAALNVGGTTASGNLRSDPGGFSGSLAVAGGGLTVIANAPNPAGFSILRGHFDDEAIHPLGLLAAALLPTLSLALITTPGRACGSS